MTNAHLQTQRDKKGSGYQNPKTENHMKRDTLKGPASQSKDQQSMVTKHRQARKGNIQPLSSFPLTP